MHGVLVVDKPQGPTSHDIVARARRTLHIPRVGHTGTLDPFATGVLPLVVGQATRLARFLSAREKEYEARVRLGVSTDTYDATGRALGEAAPESDRLPGLAVVEEALAGFRGTYLQSPPAFSAKKVGGVRAYRLAKSETPVVPPAVEVTVSKLDVVSFGDGQVGLSLVCSAGFYVRTLAHDLGARLGCGAHLEALRRIRSGDFGLADALSIDEIERLGEAARAKSIPLEQLLTDWPGVVLTEEGARRAAHGNLVGPGDLLAPAASVPGPPGRVRLLDGRGRLVGLGEPGPAPGSLHPAVVLV